MYEIDNCRGRADFVLIHLEIIFLAVDVLENWIRLFQSRCVVVTAFQRNCLVKDDLLIFF